MRTDGLTYEACEGTLEWAMKRVEGHVTSLRGRWAPMADLVADVLRPMSREQRSRCVERMGHTEDMPTTMRLRAWAGAAVRENVPAQDDEGPGIEILPFSDPRAQAAFLEGWNRGRRESGKPEARTAKEARAVMGSGFMGDLSRIMAAPDTRTVEQKLADERYDPFGDEVAA